MKSKAIHERIKKCCVIECRDILCYFDGVYLLIAFFAVVLAARKFKYGLKEPMAIVLSFLAFALGVGFHFAVKRYRCRHCT